MSVVFLLVEFNDELLSVTFLAINGSCSLVLFEGNNVALEAKLASLFILVSTAELFIAPASKTVNLKS